MNKILLSILAVLLLSACMPDPPLTTTTDWNGLNLATDTKCPPAPPATGNCASGPIVALIDVDANGAPTGVAPIESCAGKKVTWKYTDDVAANAPAFFIIFNPEVSPGNSTYDPISKPKPNPNNATNQELTLNTRALGITGVPECLNYMIVVPDKGILDPVFIIKK